MQKIHEAVEQPDPQDEYLQDRLRNRDQWRRLVQEFADNKAKVYPFNPFAGEDDGSCSNARVEGCAYADADNYNPAANVDDGSCIFSGSSSCPTDIDGDGSTAVGDLLVILGAFGQPCAE